MNTKIEILVVDYPHSDNLFSEIWFEDTLIAVLNQEHEDLEIELYPLKKGSRLRVDDFCEAVEKAKQGLKGE